MNKNDIIAAWVWLRETNNYIPDDVLDLMKDAAIEKLASHTEVKGVDWEIISFSYTSGNATIIIPKLKNGLFHCGFEEVSESYCYKEEYDVHSVRRLSDNSVWTVGEDTPDGKIISFEKYNEDHIKVNLEGNKYLWFHTLCKLPESTTEKPPIGIMPEYIWKEQRLYELNQAIIRYINAGLSYPKEWSFERENLINETKHKQ